MRKICKLVGMAMAAIVCMVGCGMKEQSSIQTKEPDLQRTKPKTTEVSSESATTQIVAGKEVTEISAQFEEGINNFSFHIFEQLDEGENIFISPYSMAIAISMLDNGAEQTSKEEIEQMLGINDLEDWNANVRYYMSLNKEEQAKLLTANSLWMSEQLSLSENAEDEFFSPVKYYYDADTKQMDLASQEALEQINQWVSDKTEGMIDSLFSERLNSDIKMLLLNAVYFKGEWKEKFEQENTNKENFYGKDKTTEIDMMCQYDKSYRYIEKDGIKAIELPYANDKIVMDILLPETDTQKDENQINQLFAQLTDQEKEELFSDLSQSGEKDIHTLKIPKFDMEYGLKDISGALQALGMESAFSSQEFSKISPEIFVSSVLHKAKIEVDEEGTKAAAVTVIEMENDCVIMDEKKDFIADKPFIFAIRDVEHNMILFMGSMQNCE